MSQTDICTVCSDYGCNTYEVQIDSLENRGNGDATVVIYIVRDDAQNAITGFDGTILVNEEPVKTFDVSDVSRLGKTYSIDFTAYAGDSIGVFLRTTAWDGCRLRVTQALPPVFSPDNVYISEIETQPAQSFTPGEYIQVTPTIYNDNERAANVELQVSAGENTQIRTWKIYSVEKQPIGIWTPEDVTGEMDVCVDILSVEPGLG